MSTIFFPDPAKVLESDNIRLSADAGRGPSRGLVGVGIVATFVAFIVGGLVGSGSDAKVAVHALHVGFLFVLSLTLGGLGFVMIGHAVNAGWWSLLRRQFEHLMSLIWLTPILFGLVIVAQIVFTLRHGDAETLPYLWDWMKSSADVGAKAPYLNIPFFTVRAIIYFVVWLALAAVLRGLSQRQDEDGDRWHTLSMARVSVVGLVLYAITGLFAATDWIMNLDYHWFSTMLPVYFFAGNIMSVLATVTLVCILLRTFGKLHGAFTVEHMHDMVKLFFGFIVFWAYVTFSQYFLIWYAGIPEETMWFIVRRESWTWVSWLIPIAHFVVPFLVLLPKPMRRNTVVVAAMCVWMLGMHVVDLFWNVRPEVAGQNLVTWIDVLAIAGPICVFAGLLVRAICSGPLVPLHDPRTHEAIEHRNWV